MELYYGVIYFKNGSQVKTGTFSGAGADRACERATAQQFDRYMSTAVSDFFKPTRYEVKVQK